MKPLELHRVRGSVWTLFSKKHCPSYFLPYVTKTESKQATNVITMSILYDFNICAPVT